MKTNKCQECKKVIKGEPAIINNKKVCKDCFEDIKYKNRLKREGIKFRENWMDMLLEKKYPKSQRRSI